MIYLIQHPVELISGFNNTVTIVAVHNKDKTLCVLEVMPPEGSDLFTEKCVQSTCENKIYILQRKVINTHITN